MVRLIQATVEAGRRNGIWVGVCGEMASDIVLVPLLLGLGIDELGRERPQLRAQDRRAGRHEEEKSPAQGYILHASMIMAR